MAKSFDTWKNQSIGKKIDLDNQSYDCVDVSKSWGEFVNGVSWTKCCGWGNAKDIYANWSDAYWIKVPRGNRPQPGDVFVMNGTVGGGYGHTGVVLSVDGNNMTVAQQDTFRQVAVYTGVFSWNASYITGFLRPKVAFTVGTPTALEGWQRKVGVGGVNYRKAASINGEKISLFPEGDVLDFKGYVHGDTVEGNNIWFVGRYTGGYAWSGGFTDTGTHDLTDLTPATNPVGPTQRQVGNDVMNYRKEPKLAPDNVIRTYNPGEIISMDGWVHGQSVDGNDVWFRVAQTGGYIWSGGFVDSSTHDLAEITSTPTTPPPAPTYPLPTADPLVTKVYNKKNPVGDYAPVDLVSVGNGQTLRKEAADSLTLMQTQTSLLPQSGYRSKATQAVLYNNYVKQDGQAAADRYSARPGYSEHQTGLTMDFAPIDDSFKTSTASAWLTSNAHKYGWILRYPSDKEAMTGYMSEPWHWRYVGVVVATDMKNKGVTTLEEYYGVAGGGYEDPTQPPNEPPTEPPVEPPVVVPPKDDDEKNATVEAMKTLGRNGLLGAISALLTAVGNWALFQLAGVHMPQEVLVSLGGVLYAGLLYLDKWIHENPKLKSIGLIKF